MDSVCEFFRVPRVDDERAVERLCCTGEFREDHDSVAFALRGDIFVGYEVHAVAGGRDETGVGDGVEGGEFFEGHRLMEEVDGHEFDGTKTTVNTADEFVDDGTEILVFFDVLTRGDSNLD